ncbi:hypothetical protein LTR22_023294 [Elasticomyces elasticus]|nr:hypothetical protein LTR22_023294 [Elasticomyces elasticus]
MDYVRVMKGSEEYMLQQCDAAIAAIGLQQQEDELMFGEDAEWTSRAVRMLHEAKEKVRGIGNPPVQPKKPETQPDAALDERPLIIFNDSEEGVPDIYLQHHATHAPSIPTTTPSFSDDPTPAVEPTVHETNNVPRTLHEMRQRQNPVRPEPSGYLFYQAPLHYYLSPLDIRIPKTAFTQYQNFPSSILPRVERVSNGHVVDDDLRKKAKFLGHLPDGCEVGFLECDWTDTVLPQILAELKPMLERRRKKHDEKEAREEKERVRIERLGDREMSAIGRGTKRNEDDPTLSTEWEALPSTAASYSYDTSGSGNEASPSTSPTAHRTVWGTTAIASTSPDLQATLPSDNDFKQRDDGWLQGWERDLLDEGIAASMAGVSIAGSSKDVQAVAMGASSGGGKKGKNGKKITLMITTARRGA